MATRRQSGAGALSTALPPQLGTPVTSSCKSVLKSTATERCAGGFMLAPGEVHPWHAPALPSREAFAAAPTGPVLVTPNPMVSSQAFNGIQDPAVSVPVNAGPLTIDSSLFSGVMEIHLRGLPNTCDELFDGRKRFFQVMCQGRFKRSVKASALCMGQEFVKPGNAPPWLGELVFTAAAKVFSSSTQVDAYAPLPYFMNPLLAACQLVHVASPGNEPPLADATEDMRLFSPSLADKHGKPLCATRRRRWCDTPRNLEGQMLSPEHVYTFHIWQHLIDFSSYKLSVGGFVNVDLAAALNGQPLQLTVQDTQAKEYLFSLLVWHERLLYGSSADSRDAAAAAASAAAAALSQQLGRLGSGLRGLLGRSAAVEP